MNPRRWYAAIALAAVTVAIVLPVSAAVPAGDVSQARFVAAILAVVVCGAFALLGRGYSGRLTPIALAAAIIGIGLLAAYINASSRCVAIYDGNPVLIGVTLSPSGAAYVSQHPGLSASDLLLDAGGVADRIWTPESISFCRLQLTWAALLATALLTAAVCALAARRSFPVELSPAPSQSAKPAQPSVEPIYDAFVSYRHGGADQALAQQILEVLESRNLRVAIDFRDFVPNQHFLSEMERCIKQSRFTLCLVTSRYLNSDNTGEEALISKTLDMAERRRRLVPLICERVDLPVWLYGLVGIDFTDSASVDPFERLVNLLKSTPEKV